MKEMLRGEKVKIQDFTTNLQLQVEVSFDSPYGIDIACFGLDKDKLLADERYLIFYNQTHAPFGEVKLTSHRSGYGKFIIDLAKLPKTITNLVFTAAIDGDGTMSMIHTGSIIISANGEEILRFGLIPGNFTNEKSVVLSEIYYKSLWKAGAVGNGFNGGLASLLEHFGGEQSSSGVESQPVPSIEQPGAPEQNEPMAYNNRHNTASPSTEHPDAPKRNEPVANDALQNTASPSTEQQQNEEIELPIYALDIETRLMIDLLDFEDRKTELPALESEAFLLFKKLLEEGLENHKLNEKDFSISADHLKFKRYIDVLVNVIEQMEDELQTLHDSDTSINEEKVALYAAALCFACHYRYPFGLYNCKATIGDYLANKVKEVPDFENYFNVHFHLATVTEEATKQYKHHFKIDPLEVFFGKEISFSESEKYSAYARIQNLLYSISLETNYDWQYAQERELSYWETKVITEDVLAKLRNQLRHAYLDQNEYEIKILVYSINLVSNYFIPLHGGTSIEADEIPFEMQLYSDYLNINLLGESIYNTSIRYADDVRILGTRGHGVAAERANHMIDRIHGKDATLVGDDNAPNGADRKVGDTLIQTKYCSTGGKCIGECFENGKFRYEINGKPMTIEVPKDKYDDAIKSMKERIKRGDMKNLGITDPEKAKDIVKKGNISYKTAQRIAKAGTIEGVLYDSGTGVIQASQAFGISVTVSFAQSLWRGEEIEEAVSDAVKNGTKVFGTSLAQHIATKQIGRTVVEKSLRPMTDYFTKEVLGSKASAKIVNTFVRTSSQRAISGAAATNQLSKVMRGNMVTVAVTTAVMSSGHIYDAIEGRISGKQLFKNISTAGAGVGGAAIGASIGSVVPVVGTLVGGVVGGWIGGKVSKSVLDKFIEDDAVSTYETLKSVFVSSIEELELDRDELNFIMDYIFDQKQLPKKLKLIFAANDHGEYIETMLDPYIEATLKARPKVMNTYLLD